MRCSTQLVWKQFLVVIIFFNLRKRVRWLVILCLYFLFRIDCLNKYIRYMKTSQTHFFLNKNAVHNLFKIFSRFRGIVYYLKRSQKKRKKKKKKRKKKPAFSQVIWQDHRKLNFLLIVSIEVHLSGVAFIWSLPTSLNCFLSHAGLLGLFFYVLSSIFANCLSQTVCDPVRCQFQDSSSCTFVFQWRLLVREYKDRHTIPSLPPFPSPSIESHVK